MNILKDSGKGGGAWPSLICQRRGAGGGLTIWPLGGLEVEHRGTVSFNMTLRPYIHKVYLKHLRYASMHREVTSGGNFQCGSGLTPMSLSIA
jgi:hypothetical protein